MIGRNGGLMIGLQEVNSLEWAEEKRRTRKDDRRTGKKSLLGLDAAQGETDWDWKKWQRSSQREEAEKRRAGRAEERTMGHLYWVL